MSGYEDGVASSLPAQAPRTPSMTHETKPLRVVVKVGTSSTTDETGRLNSAAIEKLCSEIAATRAEGHQVILVSSGAITAGVGAVLVAV